MLNYDEIRNYWDGRASNDDSPQSTTQDIFLREIEFNEVNKIISKISPKNVSDVGCGDGRTTSRLSVMFKNIGFQGYDYSKAMVANANHISSNYKAKNIVFKCIDICDEVPLATELVYTTRCLINLPSWDLQMVAIKNIYEALPKGGHYLMIENFQEGQDNFNNLRRQYSLPEVKVREHNNFFKRDVLLAFMNNLFTIEEDVNISSTYYLVSRVIYSKICQDQGILPDYFDRHHQYASTLPFAGEYGPVRLILFKKR